MARSGKVILKDGKVVFVRHGGIFGRVSPNRLLEAGCEYATPESVSTPQCSGDEFLTYDLLVKGSSSHIVSSKSVLQETLQYSPISDGDKDSEEQEWGAERHFQEQGQDRNPQEQELGEVIQEQEDVESPQVGDTAGGSDSTLEKDDRIQYRCGDEWVDAKVTGRGGKATSQYKFWFNIIDDAGLQKCVDLEDKDMWSKIGEVNVVLIPRKRHSEPTKSVVISSVSVAIWAILRGIANTKRNGRLGVNQMLMTGSKYLGCCKKKIPSTTKANTPYH